jgi:DNA-binding beta-propeller fold protein YncE
VVDRGVTDKIIRADLDGTDATDLGSLAGTLDNPCGIALDLDNSKMYVTNCGNNTISRANLDGTGGESLGDLSNTLDEPQAIALDLDNSKMYVVNGNGDTISCADLNGTNAVTLTLSPALTLYGPTGIALDLDNGHMYVVNSGNLIYRANLDGTDATDLGNLAGTLGNPFGIALDLRQPSPAAAVPTLSEWGMIILSLLMAGSAILIIRRRKLA